MRLRLEEGSEKRERFGDGNGLDEKEWFREIEDSHTQHPAVSQS